METEPGKTEKVLKLQVVEEENSPCYAFSELPMLDLKRYSSQITEYMPCKGAVPDMDNENRLQDIVEETKVLDEETGDPVFVTVEVEGEDGSIVQETKPAVQQVHHYQVTFFIYADVTEKKLLLNPGNNKSYIDGNVLVKNDNGNVTAEYVLEIEDFHGNPTGKIGYGYVNLPTNIPDTGVQSHSEFFFRKLLFSLDPEGNAFSSGAYFAPVTLQAIKPGQTPSRDGDIYDRYYEVEQVVSSTHADLPMDADYGKGIWMDKASTLKSIRTEATDFKYRELETEYVPDAMCQGIENLANARMRLDDSYFDLMLVQLRQLLNQIQDELLEQLDVKEVRNICVLDYYANVSYPTHIPLCDFKDKTYGLFGYVNQNLYDQCKAALDNQMYGEFFTDYSTLIDRTNINLKSRSYNWIFDREEILDNKYLSKAHKATANRSGTGFPDLVFWLKHDCLEAMYKRLDIPHGEDILSDLFGNHTTSTGVDLENYVRYMNLVRTHMAGDIIGMYVFDGFCNIFTKDNEDERQIWWYKFDSSKEYMDYLIDQKRQAEGNYTYDAPIVQKEYPILNASDFVLRFLNRDLTTEDPLEIEDAYIVKCYNPDDWSVLYWFSPFDCYIYTKKYDILDMAYEQTGNSLYVLFENDNHVYRYDNLQTQTDSSNRILLVKENATMKIETMHSISITNRSLVFHGIYLDYTDKVDAHGNPVRVKDKLQKSWTITLYGKSRSDNGKNWRVDVETWGSDPGSSPTDFLQYNTIFFGDSLFDEAQLRFQNISKNKDMFDILDINEVDNCYYGLFKDESNRMKEKNLGYDTYTVFKTATDGGVVRRLPYEIVTPKMYRSADDLYSLFAVVQTPVGTNSDGTAKYKLQLREISVPDSDLYADRAIDIQDLLEHSEKVDTSDGLVVSDVIMSTFRMKNSESSFFTLSNKGFHKFFYVNKIDQLSVDKLDGFQGFKPRLKEALKNAIVNKHLQEKHRNEQSYYFDNIARKINQFAPGFSTFSLIPTEFTETQDIGVIPDSKVDDTDIKTDHRPDSVQVSTDILYTDGLVMDGDANPGFVTAAISNPSTTYDNAQVIIKAQRNPQIESTEFYDYMYDSNGNVLLDLYLLPYIYRINSNNTYDLFINVPTTRTKYINRIAGTLKPDGTSRVLTDDTRTRRNFFDEALPNNLDESTTRLRVFIDRKYISVGNIELVEISGNSVPLQIYRDVPNDGLYDSIALESRWNGEVVEYINPEKDINKVMLEFEVYGTDSQSIHI